MIEPNSTLVLPGPNFNIIHSANVIPYLRNYDATRAGELRSLLEAGVNWAQVKTNRHLTTGAAVVDFYSRFEAFNVLSYKIDPNGPINVSYYNAQNQFVPLVNPDIIIESLNGDTDVVSVDPASLNIQYNNSRIIKAGINYTPLALSFDEASIVRLAISKFVQSLWYDNTEESRMIARADAEQLVLLEINEIRRG